jgi:hypothetical protein
MSIDQNLPLPVNAFGDPFDIRHLALRRPAGGYAVQKLDSDLLLDQLTAEFLPVRSPKLKALYSSFDDAHQAAARWLASQLNGIEHHNLAIVPASFDELLQRHILIYGVLRSTP